MRISPAEVREFDNGLSWLFFMLDSSASHHKLTGHSGSKLVYFVVVLSLCMYTQLHTFTFTIYIAKMSGYQFSYREQWLQKLKRLGKPKPRWVDYNPPGSCKTEVVSKCSTPFSHIYMFRVVIHIIREQPQFETVEDT